MVTCQKINTYSFSFDPYFQLIFIELKVSNNLFQPIKIDRSHFLFLDEINYIQHISHHQLLNDIFSSGGD